MIKEFSLGMHDDQAHPRNDALAITSSDISDDARLQIAANKKQLKKMIRGTWSRVICISFFPVHT